jgi:hypothetical protein
LDFDTSALILAWVVIVLLSLGMAGILRQVQALASRRSDGVGGMGPIVGTKLRVMDGVVDLDADVSILVFLDTQCESCQWVLPELGERRIHSPQVRIRALYRGLASGEAIGDVDVVDEQDAVFRRLGISATPFAVGVTSSGRVVASDVIGSPAGLHAFLAQATERGNHR